ncbi:O-antigen ligase family protein [Hymenobacter sp. BT683]|uniref:O-antigen ligase family protein n=1 Tax=Hymenobacter jeongseonensis TaxID=2791027 RepID=A0ABS0IDM1_9BACT|nr:O-antigen ligase family protein [Hymenobacter jeongseonensis]MBF9236454.1 O-antigen ligase family protein [Hymenobacter jeongseonensis]
MPYYYSGRLSQHLLWLACAAGVAGLLASRALVALAPLVGVCAVLANPNLRREGPRYFRNGAAMRAAALFVFLVISGLYTSEWATWRHEVFRSLPWLGVPLAFTLAVPLSGRQRLAVGSLFVLGTAAVGLATLAQYLLDPASANAAIRIGQNMQSITRVFHIYFGVMLALSFFWGLLLRRHMAVPPWLRGALLGAAAAAVLTLHVLAYRTGLLVLYAGLLAYVGWLLTQKRLLWGLGMLALLALGPVLAYHTLESVQHRVDSTLWDLHQYKMGQDINNYSLSKRLAAAETAYVIIRQHWLLGVGPADAHAIMREQYDWRDFGLRDSSQADVHNQYLNALLGGGLIGLGLWLAVLFWPLTRRWARRNPYVCFFILIQATAMLVTDTLSLQIGLNMFVFGYGFLVVAGEADEQRKLPLRQ